MNVKAHLKAGFSSEAHFKPISYMKEIEKCINA